MTRPARPPLYISAPIAALVEGIYREDTTVGRVRANGDFGLGTFNDLDGEMVVLDGTVWQLRADGTVCTVDDGVQTPFACVTRFHGDTQERFAAPIAADRLETVLHGLLPSTNLVYAVRVDGRFDHVRARSVPRQDNYRPLAEVAKIQTVFDFPDVEGTLVGFWTPGFLSSVHVAGFHLHFLSADRHCGGHVLAAATRDVTVRLQHVPAVRLELPMTLDFLTMESTRDLQADIHAVER
ncbi:acetolactate decarboxylase [Azospirillum halopraeferens]|uniref:acetolactate decarboxylase n=1 Tax=Azospirillum halopraeferens TaxID=34010 RepID=UPI0004203BB0|nr:acetolactate decarboxylase [Azospirillum halopraeferens]